MRKSFLGRTGLAISELAFGGGVTGGILINPDEAIRHDALQRAVAAGINWIDTAAIYGDGASEETIGRHLRELTPRPDVSTKVRLEADDMHDVAGAIERGLERSLRRLQSESLTLFQLHNHLGHGVGERLALPPEQVLRSGGVADTFDRLKEQGLIRAGGMTAAGDTAASTPRRSITTPSIPAPPGRACRRAGVADRISAGWWRPASIMTWAFSISGSGRAGYWPTRGRRNGCS